MSARKWIFVLPWEISYPGGVNQVVSSLITEFSKTADIEPHLLIDRVISEEAPMRNVDVPTGYIALSNPCWAPGILGIVKYLIKLPFILFSLKRYIGDAVACINPHYPSLNVLNYVLLKVVGFYQGKIILSFHGSDLIFIRQSKGIEKRLWLYIFKFTDAMVCCSESLARELADFVNRPALVSKIKVVHNGIDAEALARKVTIANPFPDALLNRAYILNVATFECIKGQDVLIKAFAKMKNRHNLKLCLIGRSSSHLKEYKMLAQRLGCSEDVVFIVDLPHQDVLTYFKHAQVFCLPSRNESFGIVILEAGYFACPVVASPVGGVPEIIRSDVDGILVEANEVDKLAEALDALLVDDQRSKRLGVNLQDKVLHRFTWHAAANKYLELL